MQSGPRWPARISQGKRRRERALDHAKRGWHCSARRAGVDKGAAHIGPVRIKMSESLVWRDAWAIGVGLLDEQHREMVMLINALLGAARDEPAGAKLDALIGHLRRHFETEQVFLRAIDYPLAERHRCEHALQMAEFVDLRRDVARSAGALGDADRAAIRQWFFNHVVAEDRRFGAYYRRVVCGAAD
jgi:hemerythrin